jgi:hypothetical protein
MAPDALPLIFGPLTHCWVCQRPAPDRPDGCTPECLTDDQEPN